MSIFRSKPGIVGIAVSAALLSTAWSCGADDDKGVGDAPIGYYDDRPGVIVNMPDGYPNWRIQCRNGDALISFRDEAGGQRAILDRDSNQCDGNKVKKLPSDIKVSGDDPDDYTVDESSRSGTTTTTLLRDGSSDETTTTLDR